MKVGIIITCRNLIEYTKQAIESIDTVHPMCLTVIDDDSTDDTKLYLKALKEAYPDEVVVHTDPLSYSLADKWNLGVRTCIDAGCDVFLICNNDIIFAPCTIDNLVARISKGDVGMVTAHNIRGALADPKEIHEATPPELPSEAPHPDFSCFMISRDTWEVVGEFDTKFIPMYFEDGDYHLRMSKAGIRAITTTAAPYYHYGSTTQHAVPGGMCKPAQFDRLREYLRSKHGTVPGEPEYERICKLPWETANAN